MPLPQRRVFAFLTALLAFSTSVYAAPSDWPTILFTSGTVTLTSGGTAQRLRKDSVWRAGEVLRASADGRAQLRFPDGTLLSISPGAHVRLDGFRYDGQTGTADLAAFTVFRGSARFMAGSLRTQGSALRISTPVAALASPGGELMVTVATPGGTQVSVGAGQADLRNDAGRLALVAGQRAFVRDRGTPPVTVGTIVPAPVTPTPR